MPYLLSPRVCHTSPLHFSEDCRLMSADVSLLSSTSRATLVGGGFAKHLLLKNVTWGGISDPLRDYA